MGNSVVVYTVGDCCPRHSGQWFSMGGDCALPPETLATARDILGCQNGGGVPGTEQVETRGAATPPTTYGSVPTTTSPAPPTCAWATCKLSELVSHSPALHALKEPTRPSPSTASSLTSQRHPRRVTLSAGSPRDPRLAARRISSRRPPLHPRRRLSHTVMRTDTGARGLRENRPAPLAGRAHVPGSGVLAPPGPLLRARCTGEPWQ